MVGHVPRKISAACSLFLHQNGSTVQWTNRRATSFEVIKHMVSLRSSSRTWTRFASKTANPPNLIPRQYFRLYGKVIWNKGMQVSQKKLFFFPLNDDRVFDCALYVCCIFNASFTPYTDETDVINISALIYCKKEGLLQQRKFISKRSKCFFKFIHTCSIPG